MASKSTQKGAAFERKACKALSLWWTVGKRDDIFWRTQCSGGRFTTRKKAGLDTAGQQGDVAATDEEGLPFLGRYTVELKCGYPGANPLSIITGDERSKFWEFVTQASKCKTKYWMIIHAPTLRPKMVYTNNPVIVLRKFVTVADLDKELTVRGYTLQDFLASEPRLWMN